MLLQLAAAVRSTETWTVFHIGSLVVLAVAVVWVLRLIRVGRSK